MQAELQFGQFRSLQRNVPILYSVLAINTFFLAFSFYGTVSKTLSLIVPGIFITLIGIRSVVWLSRRGIDLPLSEISRQLVKTTIVAGVLSGALGTWCVALLFYADASQKASVPMFIAFGSITCAYCLANVPRAAFATICFAPVLVCGALLWSGVLLQIAMGINLLLVLGLILRFINYQYGDFEESVSIELQMRSLAYLDPLTGLPNRRAFIEAIERAATQYNEGGPGFCLAMIDLDDFKSINDTDGHPVGDEVLIETAARIRTVLGPGDVAARLGGDEFAIVSREFKDEADELGQRLATALSAPFLLRRTQIRLAASIGIATCPQDGTERITLMSRADVALYRAKSRGGREVLSFTPDMEESLLRRVKIEQALREIDPYPLVEIVFQPIYDTMSNQITTFEALARWNHPDLGIVEPLEFIDVAERIGVMSGITERIFATAIAEATYWPAQIGLSLNLSGVHLCDFNTPLMIMSLLKRHGLSPDRLEIEITETSMLTDFGAARKILGLLRATGIRIVLDDFGAGYASIGYLKEIAFDRVKIDGEIISDIVGSHRAKVLLDGILRLCAATGIPATAEKVETEEQLLILQELGCDRVQGYLLGRPLEIMGTRRLLTSGFRVVANAS
jgi:diguanylate cyclase (GGDEF)-like protein